MNKKLTNPTFEERTTWAMETIKKSIYHDEEPNIRQNIIDLIADMLHLCDRESLSPAHILHKAAAHYDAEADFSLGRTNPIDPIKRLSYALDNLLRQTVDADLAAGNELTEEEAGARELAVNTLADIDKIIKNHPSYPIPRIIITTDGGLIEDIFSDAPIDVRVINYDIWEGSEPDPDTEWYIHPAPNETAKVSPAQQAEVNMDQVDHFFRLSNHLFPPFPEQE